jgi:uncharacterized OsmC-like protein
MALKDIIIETQTDLLANPDHAIATFSVDSRQTDTGPNPVEFVLAALATCQEITYRAYATALGIPLESVSVTLEGSLDLRGFFAVKDGVRAGFNDVRGVVNLKSSAPDAELAKLKDVVDGHCPVLDILRAPVPVDLRLETSELLKRPDEPDGGAGPLRQRVRDRPRTIRYARWSSATAMRRMILLENSVARLRARRQLATDFQRRGRYQHPVPHLAAGDFVAQGTPIRRSKDERRDQPRTIRWP